MTLVQEIVKTNTEDDSSMLQAWTVPHRPVLYTLRFYNVEANTECQLFRREVELFPHCFQKYIPASSPILLLKPHIGKPNQKIDLAGTEPQKTSQDTVFSIKVHLVSCMATQVPVPEQEVQKHLPFTSAGRSSNQGIAV